MNHLEVGKFWNDNAEAWTTLVRAGYDLYRDLLNTPAFFEILPPIQGLEGLDIGCGEGYNTRLLAKQGAKMTALDIAEKFIENAQASERESPLGIDYQVASAVCLPYENEKFDFVASFMCFMDIAETKEVIKEAFRVLKKGGFLQFSITHPCFDTPHRRNLRNEHNRTYAMEVGGYFDALDGQKIEEWIFGAAPQSMKAHLPKFKVPKMTRTLSFWFNTLLEAGFAIEKVNEPRPDDATVTQYPYIQDAQVVSYFLHIRCRKP